MSKLYKSVKDLLKLEKLRESIRLTDMGYVNTVGWHMVGVMIKDNNLDLTTKRSYFNRHKKLMRLKSKYSACLPK